MTAPEAPVQQPDPRRGIKAHHFGRAALVLAGISCAVVLFIAGAAIRLLIGPVSLGPFAGSLSAAIDRAAPGITVKYDQAAVEWERDEGRITLAILGTRVLDQDGRIIAQAPKADIGIAAGPFLQGHIEVKRISLVGVQLTLVRGKDGALRLGLGNDERDEDILKRISDALSRNEGPSTLESFAIKRARLAFYDEASKLFVVAPRADFRLTHVRGNEDLAAGLDADIEISGFPAHIRGTFALPAKNKKVKGHVTLSGLSIHALAINSPAFSSAKDTTLTVDMDANFEEDGAQLVMADFVLKGKGAVTVPQMKNGRITLSELSAQGHFDGKTNTLNLDHATLIADKIKANLKGRLSFGIGGTGALSGISGALKINRLGFAWPGVFAAPVVFDAIDLRAAWRRDENSLTIDRLSIAGAPFAMQADGRLQFVDGQSPGVEVKGTIAALSVRDLVRYWPLNAAGGGRSWAQANMPSGRIGPISFALHFSPGLLDQATMPAEAVSAKAAVTDADVNTIDGLTHLTGVNGVLTVTGVSLTADIVSGHVGTLVAGPSRFTIPDFNVAEEVGVVDAHLRGPMADVLALADMGKLRYPTRFGINAASAKGDAAVDLDFRIPMLHSVSVDQIKIGIKANISGFGLTLGPHTQITDGTVQFLIDNARLHATGTAGLGGSPSRLALDWTEEFKTAQPVTTRVTVKGLADEVVRAALGINAKDYIKGPIGVSGTLLGHRGALTQAAIILDLTPTVVSLDLMAINKSAGAPMAGRLGLTFGPGSAPDALTLRINGAGANASATARLDASGKLINLQAPNIHLGAQNDFSLNVTRGVYGIDVAVRGHALDGSHLGGQSGGPGEAHFEEPFHISAKLDRLVLRDGVALANTSLDISGVADRPATMNLSAVLSKTANLSVTIGPSESGRRLALSTGDMGLLLKGLFGFSSMQGGKLDISAQFNGRADQTTPGGADVPDFQGKAVLKDFRVLNQPFLARLFSAGSLMGLGNLMQGQGIAVDSFEVPFSSRNGVISVRDVRATGPAIGVTAEGYIDRPKNAIAVKGSLVPLFGLNSVLGNIPLIGTVITSKEGEGIIGMTYSVTGSADEPSVSVNPLSALAPGILRRIFEGRVPNASQAPSNAPQPAAPAKPKTN